jgi:signal transduction histidine kinase
MTITFKVLRQFEVFKEFSDEELVKIAALCQEERHANGVKLFNEGDPAEKFYLVLKGKISLEKRIQLGRSGSSRHAPICIRGPGQLVGWTSIVEPHVYVFSAVCLEPSKLLAIEGHAMRYFMAQNPQAGLRFMAAIATLIRERMEATTSTLTYFLSTISHELKAPLAAVENYLEVMLGGFAGETTVKQQKMLERSVLRVKDLRFLINNILDIARMQPEQVQADFERISPTELILQSLEDVRLLARQKNIHICLDVSPQLGEIVAAPRRLRQVLTNLLSNAVKFSPEAGRVWLSAVEQPDTLQIEVIDEGVGIPIDEQKYVFEDFFRAGNVQEESGTGLGLSIAKKIIEAHHGYIGFQSPYAPGKPGVKFTVFIPKNLVTPAMKQEEWKSAHEKDEPSGK